ncbi:MAG TPA: ribosome biogenesis GTP-binding protein YihA/YsxC [Polyangia bacterium]|nr:ribosome biogenesis GTP-binding protein YihA/YsxC [Polyangia bacterium]
MARDNDRVPRPPEVRDAVFLAEARDAGSLPPAGAVEIAIAGRSNVGKSTLLNRLANRKGLARTSRTPGRTRGIVLFELKLGKGAPLESLRLCDLPGYGYAKVSRTERDSWQPLIEGYTRGRATLALFVVLVDARRGVEDEERQLYEWLGSENVPAQIVFTKVDKLSASERGLLRERTRQMFGAGKAGRRATPLLVSAETGEGVPELWGAIFSAATVTGPSLAEPPRSA